MPGCTRCAPFTTMTSPAFSPSRTTRRPSTTRPSFTLRYSICIVGAEQQHIFLALVGVDGAVVDHDRGIFVAAQQLHAGEQAGRELPVLVCSTARARIVPVCGLSWLSTKSTVPCVRKALLVGQPDVHRLACSACELVRCARLRAICA